MAQWLASPYDTFMTRCALALFAMCVSACGFSSPGGGSKTLYVVAHMSGDGSFNGSRARVTVRGGSERGEAMREAEVAIRGGTLGRTLIPWDEDREEFRLDSFTWVPGVRLEVVRGDDWLDGAIDVPGATLITNPIADSTFRRADNVPLVVRWRDEFGTVAQDTRVRFDKADIEKTAVRGSLEFVVPPNDLRVDDKEKVRVQRSNEIQLEGGAPGSVLTASSEHEIEFKVE
ncbi:MAG: hypothetical protein DI536_24605 [Archangium gephyra]|uniref:Lipoprotein n=1 Tax=Archangium gephyra TaxID=48 RepID=A0A2W5T7P8_9BACT|nr:MAG: hypothetical protein DI536_24605 [Archangium gephyra]